MIIYVSILAMLMLVVISTLVTMTRSYRTLKVSKNLNHSAVVAMERMTREIRNARTVITAQSTFDAHPGRLYLQQPGTDTTEFFMEDGLLKMNKNGVYEGPLTTSDAVVTDLTFTYGTTTQSENVRIDLTLEATSGDKVKTERFYASVVLRGSY